MLMSHAVRTQLVVRVFETPALMDQDLWPINTIKESDNFSLASQIVAIIWRVKKIMYLYGNPESYSKPKKHKLSNSRISLL